MKKLFLVLNFFGVLLSFSCNQLHDNNSIKDVGEGMAVLEFGDSIVVTDLLDDGKLLKSGDTVKEGTPVMICLKEEFENWQNGEYDIKSLADPFTVNGEAIGRGVQVSYAIPKNVSRIKIDAKVRKPEEMTIKYSKNLKVYYYTQKGGQIFIENGGKVKEGQFLKLEPALRQNEVVETWKINTNEYKATPDDQMENYFGLTEANLSVMKDGENTTINIDYELRTAKQYTVNFDSTKMTASIDNRSTPPTEINPDDTVLEGTRLQFNAILPAGKTVDKWSLNGKEVTESTRYVSVYSTELHINQVTDKVAKDGVINVDVTFKEAKKYTVNFDNTKMKAGTYRNSTPRTEVNPDGTVLEEARLQFDAILPAGKIVDKWSLNGKEVTESMRYVSVNSNELYIHEVTDEVAEGGVINVDVTFKEAKKYTVNFDNTKMKAGTYRNSTPRTEVNPDGTVLEEARLQFDAILPAGKIVDKWSLNGKEVTESMRYVSVNSTGLHINQVTDKVAKDGVINVDVTFKEAKQYTVQFDNTKMTAETSSNSGSPTNVNSGDTVLEGTRLYFEAILPAGKIVDKWSLNGNEATKYRRYISFSSTGLYIHEVTDKVAEGDAINVDVTFKAQ